MGSITKVMTALVVLRAGDLSRKIKVTRGAIRYVGKRGASSAATVWPPPPGTTITCGGRLTACSGPTVARWALRPATPTQQATVFCSKHATGDAP
jgi:D-alanyl-D-alanine carboxypeptidase (penicillin-binding protein 5/6)